MAEMWNLCPHCCIHCCS